MTQQAKTNAPSWLALSSDRTTFVFLPERAEIIRKIFELNISGFGARAIAQLLNAKSIAVFGSGKRWDQSTVQNILTNRATFGEYHKQTKVDGTKRLVGVPIQNYYPAVISFQMFELAQQARRNNIQSRSGRRGTEIANLFFGVSLTCLYCRQQVKFYSKSHENCLICSSVISGEGECPRFGWIYRDFEETFLSCLDTTNRYPDFSNRLAAFRTSSGGDRLDARMHIAGFLKHSLENVVIASAGDKPPPSKPHRIIRRDHPSRSFEAKLQDGFLMRGFPTKCEPKGVKIEAVILQNRFSLSPRQAQITSLLVQGFSLSQVAQELSQTFETSRWHLREIFRRTSTHSQAELTELVQQICSV